MSSRFFLSNPLFKPVSWKRNFPERKGTIDEAFAAISSFLLHGCCDPYSEQQPTSDWGFIFNLGKRGFITVAAEPDTVLQLDFSNVKHEYPWQFDWFLDIYGPRYSTLFYSRPSSLPVNVKTLHLKSVSCTFSGAVSSMMTAFKFLESLTIENCHGISFVFYLNLATHLSNATIASYFLGLALKIQPPDRALVD
ncbi:hypothetical protein V6N13_074921 [Hibiscus sabdariffa]|uniref:Uncharacterized protein n=1 Tax=Hibiscus sabdariffa TaxID=183260 RepID=A0ABR2U9W0_9ROSI